MAKIKKHLLSVIVPTYKNEKTIACDLKEIEAALARTPYKHEIICVVDGKVDKTLEKARGVKSDKIKVIAYKENKGKGHAVRYGMSRASGDLIAFIDAGGDINPNSLPMLLEHMFWYKSDIIVASIRHSASKAKGYPLKRKIYSWGYHFLTKILFGLKITDSQRGLKIFKRKVLERVLPRLLVKEFAFDVEMLAVAKRLGFKNIHDGPVEMDTRKMRYSNVKSSTVFSMLVDTLAVFYRLNILRYYDDENRYQWKCEPDLNFKK